MAAKVKLLALVWLVGGLALGSILPLPSPTPVPAPTLNPLPFDIGPMRWTSGTKRSRFGVLCLTKEWCLRVWQEV